MDILHHHLEPVEAASLWHLDFSHEARSEVLEHNAVGSSKEGQHHLDEVLLVFVQSGPVLQILSQIDLFGRPETGHLVLVHLPDVVVPDRQDNEAVRVVLKQGLYHLALSLGYLLAGVLRLRGDQLRRMLRAGELSRNL